MDGLKPMPNLILPGSLEFEETLATTLPPGWQDVAYQSSGEYGFVVDPETGMMRIANSRELTEYVEGGEYDERLNSIEWDWIDVVE